MRPAVIAASAGAAWTLPALAPVVAPLPTALRVRRRLGDGADGVALTFDDGPHPEGTPAVLEVLAGAGVTATFFLVGEQVARRPALARRIVAEGHAVAVHGHHHRTLLALTPRALRADLRRACATIADATGVAAGRYRPPFGILSAAGPRVIRGAGLEPWLWSRWGRDWRARTTPARIAATVTRDVGPGDVLLLHDSDAYSARDSWRRTAAALPLVLAALRGRGLAGVGLR